ncbi:MAG: ATP-binding protein [Candidatus Sifarchaeia archaeon]
MPFQLIQRENKLLITHNVNRRKRSWIKLIWIFGTICAGIYWLVVYILPLTRLVDQPLIPLKAFVEALICFIPIISGISLAISQIHLQNPLISIENGVFLVKLDDNVIGTCCLDIVSVSGSVYLDENGKPVYNESMLLAMRAGMGKSVNMAFEAGVSNGEPFLRIFITATGHSSEQIHEILKREATRTEAILLSSLNNIELKFLDEELLRDAVLTHMEELDVEGQKMTFKEEIRLLRLITLQGSPRIFPTQETSQIGTFISTALRQGYSTSLTCVFSAAKPGKEKRILENQWKNIQTKEKRKEESLHDYAVKRKLVARYEEIHDRTGWFDATVYFKIRAPTENHVSVHLEGVNGLVHSIWGGRDSIKLNHHKISKRTIFRILTRRHLKRQRMHIAQLSSFINTPIQHLPVISSKKAPVFLIPSKELVNHELIIGETVFASRRLSNVGLSVNSLREHVAILGATGTGKTTLVKHLMAQLCEKTDVPWWIFDIKGSEYLDLVDNDESDILILRPGFDVSFVINLIDSEMKNDENYAHSTFVILRELLNERGDSSELSPAMEKLLRDSVMEVVNSLYQGNSVQFLVSKVIELAGNDRIGNMTRDALLNRLEILTRDPLGSILGGESAAIRFSDLLNRRVILDLSYVARVGGMDSARFLYNLIAKRIFDGAMKRGVKEGLHHVVVLEEASNLVPESYTRSSAADVTTGESMVMLQRATGQGVIVISTRPNISSNILANTSTKIVFRLPYDSQIGGKFLSLNEDQIQYLRTLNRGRALVSIPHAESFEIATKPFPKSLIQNQKLISSDVDSISNVGKTVSDKDEKPAREPDVSKPDIDIKEQTLVFNRIDRLGSHVVAFLASEEWATEVEVRNLIAALEPNVVDDDISEVIRSLVSLGSIERESLALVDGGFLFSLPGKALNAVRYVIVEYITRKLGLEFNPCIITENREWPDIVLEDKAVVIIPEHLRASSLALALEKIRQQMSKFRNGVNELIIVVRGSVAAAKLRELMDSSEEFNDVSVVSAFPKSLDSVIESLIHEHDLSQESSIQTQLSDDTDSNIKENLIGAMHDIGSATNRAVQIRLWFGLIQDLVDISNGQVRWEELLEFIETTALQSLKGRSAPLNIEEGKRALTELLADEVLIALRVSEESKFVELIEGLWLVNSSVLKSLKEKAVINIESELRKHYSKVSRNHGYYDLCVGSTSYVIFPNQQQLNTLLHLHSDIACRTCKSTRVVCVLTASEYLEESVTTPNNLIVKTMDDNISAFVT